MAIRSFDPSLLYQSLESYTGAPRWIVGFSGGVDSSALLESLVQLKDLSIPPILAVHVNHHLADESDRWAQHCETFCKERGIAFELHHVHINQHSDSGLEAAARDARYQVFKSVIQQNDILLLGHHQDDQAETLLIQTLRGGGVHGLAAMPVSRKLGLGTLIRPLLKYPRSALVDYANSRQLSWIEDPSNQHTRHERNYIRHQVLPMLQLRRAGVSEVLARSAEHFAESAEILDEVAKSDLKLIKDEHKTININKLQKLSKVKQHNVMRYWIHQVSGNFPSSDQLDELFQSVVHARDDATPQLKISDYSVRRFKNRIYFLNALPSVPENAMTIEYKSGELELGNGLGVVKIREHDVAVSNNESGVSLDKVTSAKKIELRWRQGGERIFLKDGHHHQLKKLYQQREIPPWERALRPLIYIDGELAQVCSHWVDNRFAARDDEKSVIFEWHLPENLK